MNPSHIEHIGIAVVDLNKAIDFYERVFSLKCYNIEEVPDQKVITAFFMVGQIKIELLQSTDPEGPIGKFIEKREKGYIIWLFAVEDIREKLKFVENSGVKLIDAVPRQGAEGLQIAFLHPKSTFGVLTELCEENGKV